MESLLRCCEEEKQSGEKSSMMMSMTTSTMDIMPTDMLLKILAQLPVKSLLRFKSVCKSWCSLIQSSEFVAQHLNHHIHHSDYNIILNNNDHPHDSRRFSLLSGEKYQNLVSPHPTCDGTITASSNGLICVQDTFNHEVTLWNPATRKSRRLPESLTPVSPASLSFILFVFDSVTSDYKVVKFVSNKLLYSDAMPKTQAEVYNLSTDSWRNIDYNLPFNCMVSDPKRPYRDGVYCWLGRAPHRYSYYRSIVLFDVHKETFETMPLPHEYCNHQSAMLAILQEKISCLFFSIKGGKWCLKLWVLGEYGVKESWKKMTTIQLPGLRFNSGILRTGNPGNGVCLTLVDRSASDSADEERKTCIFYPLTRKLVELPAPRTRSSSSDWQVAFYKESLVSVERKQCSG